MNLDQLQKIAEAATPGPWRINTAGHGNASGFVLDEVYVYAPECGVDDVAIAADIADPLTGTCSKPNADHIAACDPQTVLRLIAVARAAKTLVVDGGPSEIECLTALRSALAALEDGT